MASRKWRASVLEFANSESALIRWVWTNEREAEMVTRRGDAPLVRSLHLKRRLVACKLGAHDRVVCLEQRCAWTSEQLILNFTDLATSTTSFGVKQEIMATTAFAMPPSQSRSARPTHLPDMPHKNVPLERLPSCSSDALPIQVAVSYAGIEDNHAMYSIQVKNVVSGKSWSVSYRYSELRAFKNRVCTQWTCNSRVCRGSCEAVQDYLYAWFPQRLPKFASRSSLAVKHRRHKMEELLTHLLRCILVPGSTMKCRTASTHLSKNVFDFLQVPDTVEDRRSLMQIYIDNTQQSMLKSSFGSEASTVSESDHQCVICLDDDEEDEEVILPCRHAFHRDCVYEWLRCEFVCPLCRQNVLPSGVASYCRPGDGVFWWLDGFGQDLLESHQD